MGKQEANAQPEVDNFIHNRTVVGNSYFKIYHKTWEEWVDRRIPIKNKEGKTYKWEIKTEKHKFEKGVIENIPDIDDILLPSYAKNIQELPFFIHRLHLDGEQVLDYVHRKVFRPANPDSYKNKLFAYAYSEKERILGKEKLEQLKISEDTINTNDVRRLSITLYEWYGYFTKNRKTEKYRFIVDLKNNELLNGKPLRKINRSGRIPFVGRGLSCEPGQLRSASLMQIIAPIVNAFNNVFNQKSDFQYVTNCPFGFYKPEEGYTKAEYKLTPLVLYPVDDPTKVNIPNIQRNMAWAESDIRILFEVLERLTGAATYFAIGQQRNKTLGQDILVDKQSETRFGLWVARLQQDICEAIGMWFELYQDYPPKNLAEKILGEDGKQIFANLSIDDLRGNVDVQMTPDTVAGSKIYQKQLQLQTFQIAQQMIWFNPQLNPHGNWALCADTLKILNNWTDNDIKKYFPEQPRAEFDNAELENEWIKFMNGEDFIPPEGETALALRHLSGHTKQKNEKYQDLPEEYKANFDAHLFKTLVNAMVFIKKVQEEQVANVLASKAITSGQARQMPNQEQILPQNAPERQNNGIPGVMPGVNQ